MYSLQQTDIKDEEGVIDGVVGVFFQTSRLTLNVLSLWSPVRVRVRVRVECCHVSSAEGKSPLRMRTFLRMVGVAYRLKR